MDDYQYNQGHRNSYDRNTDRHQYEDHRNSYQDYRNQGRYQEKGEFRDYGIPLRDSQPRWNSYRGEERGEGEVVQAYGVIMEYGYVSKSAAMPAQDQPLTGTRLDLTNVWLRCEADHNNIFLTLYWRPAGRDGDMILSTFKEDLEHQLERMLEEVIRDIKSVSSSSPYEELDETDDIDNLNLYIGGLSF